MSGYDNVDFKIRFIAFTSKSSEDVAVDNILLKIADPSLFSITLSNSSSVAENASGGFVNYNIKISGYSEIILECTIDSGTFVSLSEFSTTISCIFDGARSYINHIFDYRIDPPINIYGGNTLLFAGYDGEKPDILNSTPSTFTTGAMHSNVSGVIVSGHGVNISIPYDEHILGLFFNKFGFMIIFLCLVFLFLKNYYSSYLPILNTHLWISGIEQNR